jgi:hypothetical protein
LGWFQEPNKTTPHPSTDFLHYHNIAQERSSGLFGSFGSIRLFRAEEQKKPNKLNKPDYED